MKRQTLPEIPSLMDDADFVDQGSLEWHLQRFGVFTASEFKNALTQPRTIKDREAGKLSESASTLVNNKIVEIYLLQNGDNEVIKEYLKLDRRQIKAFEWGHKYEPEAISTFAKKFRKTVLPSGFVEYSGSNSELIGWVGGSRDGVVAGERALIEVKCPINAKYQIDRLESPELFFKEHRAQVLGNMWITNADKGYLLSYYPHFPEPLNLVVYEVKRDEAFIAELESALFRLVKTIKARLNTLNALSYDK